jgi:hypothetical protein
VGDCAALRYPAATIPIGRVTDEIVRRRPSKLKNPEESHDAA